MKKYFLFLFSLYFLSCSNDILSVPAEYIQPEKMQNILTDIHLAEAIILSGNNANKFKSTSLANGYYTSIYKKYKTDSVAFRKSWEYYTEHPEIYDRVQEKVVEKLNEMQMENSKIKN